MFFTLTVIFMNEAIKILKPDVIIVFTHYALTSVIMIKDYKQLKSTVLSRDDSNQQFAKQMIMLLFTQLLWLNHSSIMFTEQHCMFSDIFRISSIIFYNDQLINTVITQSIFYSLSLKMKDFIKEQYDAENLILMLNIKNKTELIENSWCNLVNASVFITIVKNLLKTFELKHLTIISPY